MEIWTLFFAALGLTMFLEGLPYFISPVGVRRYLQKIESMSDGALRTMGLLMMLAGLLVAYLATF